MIWMQSNVTIIIQARTNSKRLYGKVLLPLNGISIIDWVCRRLLIKFDSENIFLATSENDLDTELVYSVKKYNINIFRGNEKNVFSRFVEIHKFRKSSTYIRVCADNPFVSSELIFKKNQVYLDKNVDYINSNPNKALKIVDGFGSELLSGKSIEFLAKQKLNRSELEHVTYAYQKYSKYLKKESLKVEKFYYSTLDKLDIDTKNDYRKVSLFTRTANIYPESTDQHIIDTYLNFQSKVLIL